MPQSLAKFLAKSVVRKKWECIFNKTHVSEHSYSTMLLFILTTVTHSSHIIILWISGRVVKAPARGAGTSEGQGGGKLFQRALSMLYVRAVITTKIAL